MATKERKVEIRVRVLGKSKGKIRWKVYPPLALDVKELKEKLGTLMQKWAPQQGAFYTGSESELLELIKLLGEEIISKRRTKRDGDGLSSQPDPEAP